MTNWCIRKRCIISCIRSLLQPLTCILLNRAAKSLSDGLLQNPYSIVNSPLQVMYGVTALSCGRPCPTGNGLTGICPTKMWVTTWYKVISYYTTACHAPDGPHYTLWWIIGYISILLLIHWIIYYGNSFTWSFLVISETIWNVSCMFV